MKFNFKKLLVEENSGPDGGYIGYASDADSYIQTPYKGISDPRQSTGAFGSVFQNKDGFKPIKALDSAQLDIIKSAIMSYLSGSFADPRQAIYNLKVKLNHLGLDFTFNKNNPIGEGAMSLQLSRYGEKFGTTPTTDLSKGFDRGQDYTNVALSFTIRKEPSGQFCFENIGLGNAVPMTQNESILAAIASDEYLFEKVMKPVALNLLEKRDSQDLTEETATQQLQFVIERALRKLDVNLNESQKAELINTLSTILFEEQEMPKEKPEATSKGKPAGIGERTNKIQERMKKNRSARIAAKQAGK